MFFECVKDLSQQAWLKVSLMSQDAVEVVLRNGTSSCAHGA